jgi:hypothetical protein
VSNPRLLPFTAATLLHCQIAFQLSCHDLNVGFVFPFLFGGNPSVCCGDYQVDSGFCANDLALHP